jgi:hypothetical protein
MGCAKWLKPKRGVPQVSNPDSSPESLGELQSLSEMDFVEDIIVFWGKHSHNSDLGHAITELGASATSFTPDGIVLSFTVRRM